MVDQGITDQSVDQQAVKSIIGEELLSEVVRWVSYWLTHLNLKSEFAPSAAEGMLAMTSAHPELAWGWPAGR